MTTKTFLRRYWRIPVVALLGGLLAFGASFLLQETYASSTRLLIRSRDTTFLTTTGQPLDQSTGIIDAGLSKSLAETYAGTATSREVSTMVVDELGLDQPKPEETGPVAWMANAAATTYKCGRAFITYGFCADPDPREAAIQNVQQGMIAAQLGPESGSAAGQANSLIVEIAGSGETPQEARDVTNAAADATIQVSRNRSRQDAQAYADNLGKQVDQADGAVDEAAKAVSAFELEHGITDLDQQKIAAVNTAEDSRNQLSKAQDDLAGARAELASLDATLAGLDPSSTTTESLSTGRSTTDRSSTGPSALYNEVAAARATSAGKVAELEGQVSSLTTRLAEGSPETAALTTDQADLLQLDQKLDQAKANYDKLVEAHQNALLNVDNTSVELSRIDEAGTPTYPEAPKKYLYLALGLLIGGLAGGGLTWLAHRRDLDGEGDEEGMGVDELLDDDGFDVDLRRERTDGYAGERERVPVGASGPSLFSREHGGNGYGNGHGNGHGNGNGGAGSPVARPEGDLEPS